MTGVMLRLLGLAVAAAALASPASGQSPAPDTVAESVRRAFADYEKRLNLGDYAGALEYYADDPRFFWIEHEKIVARSKADIVRGYENLKGSGARFTYEAPRITVLAPDAAVLTTHFGAQMRSGSKVVQFSGLLTLVLIRTVVGWRFLSGRA